MQLDFMWEKNPHEEWRSITFDEPVMSTIYLHTSFSLCMHITHGMCNWLFTYELSSQCHNKLKCIRLLLNGWSKLQNTKDWTRISIVTTCFPYKLIGSSSMCLLEIDPAYCTIGIIIFTLIDMNSQKVQMLLALNLNVKI